MTSDSAPNDIVERIGREWAEAYPDLDTTPVEVLGRINRIASALTHSLDRDLEAQIPRAQLTRIIRPRIEEILELARDRLRHGGHAARGGRRVVLTGGASQLTGLADLARKILEAPVRVGRPLGVKGLPEAAKGPAFAAVVGLMVYPQVADMDRIDLKSGGLLRGTGTDGAFTRFARWLKDSF